MLSMSQALERIKGDTTQFVDPPLIHSLCRELKISFRQRLLTPVVITHVFNRRILEGTAPVPELGA